MAPSHNHVVNERLKTSRLLILIVSACGRNETFPFLNETFLMHPRLHRKIDSNTEGESKIRNSLIHFDERNISTPFAIPNKTFLVQSDVLGDRMIESLKVNQKCYEEKNSVMSAWS